MSRELSCTAHGYMQETLHTRLVKRIVAQYPVSYEKLEELALSAGYTQLEFLTAMQAVHKDARIVQATRGDSIAYKPYVAKPEPAVATHVTWVRDNYPTMDETNNGQHPAFDTMDFSYLFLTPEQLDKWKAEQRGMRYIPKKRYERSSSST